MGRGLSPEKLEEEYYYRDKNGKRWLLQNIKTYSIDEGKNTDGYFLNECRNDMRYIVEAYFTDQHNRSLRLYRYRQEDVPHIPKESMHYIGFKPEITYGASEDLKLTAANLLSGAPKEDITWNGYTFSSFVFEEASEVREALNANIKTNEEIQRYPKFQSSLIRFVNSPMTQMIWEGGIDDQHKNQVSKYFGEITVGVHAFENLKMFPTNIFDDSINRFYVPDDPIFNGADSFIVTKNDELLPISSKSGSGSKASFFTNILEPSIEEEHWFQDRTLRQLQKIIVNGRDGVKSSKDSRLILYSFIIRGLLKIDSKELKDLKKFVNDLIRDPRQTRFNYPNVFLKIRNYSWNGSGADKHLEKLPYTVTGIFSRELAYLMNKSNAAKQDLMDILNMKNYFQIHLDSEEFTTNGIVDYSVILSNKSSIVVDGTKSSITDLKAEHGILNYQLRKLT